MAENTAKSVISQRQEFFLALVSENILWMQLQQQRDFASSKLWHVIWGCNSYIWAYILYILRAYISWAYISYSSYILEHICSENGYSFSRTFWKVALWYQCNSPLSTEMDGNPGWINFRWINMSLWCLQRGHCMPTEPQMPSHQQMSLQITVL